MRLCLSHAVQSTLLCGWQLGKFRTAAHCTLYKANPLLVAQRQHPGPYLDMALKQHVYMQSQLVKCDVIPVVILCGRLYTKCNSQTVNCKYIGTHIYCMLHDEVMFYTN